MSLFLSTGSIIRTKIRHAKCFTFCGIIDAQSSRSVEHIVLRNSSLISKPKLRLKLCIPLRCSSSGSGDTDYGSWRNPSYFGFFLASTVVTFLGGYYFTRDWPMPVDKQRSVVNFDALVNALERGGVSEIVIPKRSGFAYVKLIGDVHSVTEILLVPIAPNVRQFVQKIRRQEAAWGIPADDLIPIKFEPVPAGERMSAWRPIGLMLTLTPLLIIVMTKQARSFFTALRKSQPGASGGSPQSTPPSTKPRPPPPNPFEKTGPDRKSDLGGGGGLPFSLDLLFNRKSIEPVTTNVKFKDVAGMHASKEEVMEFVSYLKDSTKYQLLGAKLPKGALLLGPPGTGKTLLVKALANEADVPFYSMAGSEFVEILGGLGASRIRDLFRTARSKSPSIIFIDELDSLGRRRFNSGGRGSSGGGVSEMEHTLNQLLVEMDGMDTAEGTIVFAATNRADLLDKALLRAGRFDRHIFIDLPNFAERKELLSMYVAKYRLSKTVNITQLIERLTSWTPGMSGADIARLCNEAALVAARRDEQPTTGVLSEDFDVAFERILAGAAKRSNPLSPPERRVAAVQEAGRALIAWLLPNTGMLPIKISIVPRTSSGQDGSVGLGFTQMVPAERRLFNSEELSDRMAVLLGGRAAEQVIFNAVSDASQRYLRAATDLALKQVREWGLSKVVGHVSFDPDPSGSEFVQKPYSQRTQVMIEMEAQTLVTSAFNRGVHLVQSNKDKLQRLIDVLLEKEVISMDELTELCGPRPDKL